MTRLEEVHGLIRDVEGTGATVLLWKPDREYRFTITPPGFSRNSFQGGARISTLGPGDPVPEDDPVAIPFRVGSGIR